MKQENGAASKHPSAAIQSSLIASNFLTYMVLVAILCIVGMYAMRDPETFFIDPPVGEAIEMFPIDQPNVTSSSLIKWVTQAVTTVHTLNFEDYQTSIDSMKEYFTTAGYSDFVQGLKDHGTIKKITGEGLVVTAVATDTPVILQEGPVDGIYSWRIQVPLLINYQGASTSSTKQDVVVSLLVSRVPTDVAPKGIGIAQIIDSGDNG